jgi:hypothetical protein
MRRPHPATERLAAMVLAACVAGCARRGGDGARPLPPRSETASHGPVEFTLTADPAEVHLDRDVLLTLRTAAPSGVVVRLPPLEGRLQGFALNGSFDREAEARDGRVVRERCVRLSPLIAGEYRIAPMAVVWSDRRVSTAEQWFATPPLRLPARPVPEGAGRNLADIAPPAWITPGFGIVMRYIAAAAAAVGLGFAAWVLARRVRRAVRLHRMSPRERALFELAELVARRLVEQDRVKDFYFELTMIVRRYIERAHGIRAPEQTTEEFLAAAALHPAFGEAVVARLRAFLEAADLVKYAAFRPERPVVDRALETARQYVETDAASDAGGAGPP